MKLFETTVKYNTYDLLMSMAEMSEHLQQRVKNNPMYCFMPITEQMMTSFNTGRRTGQTIAILQYALSRAMKGKRTIIVSHKNAAAKDVRNRLNEYILNECADSFGGIKGLCILSDDYIETVSAEHDCYSRFDKGTSVIFDVCNREQIEKFFNRHRGTDFSGISSIVSVGQL